MPGRARNLAAHAACLASLRPGHARGAPRNLTDWVVHNRGNGRPPPSSVADGSPGRPAGVAGTIEPALGNRDQLDGTPGPVLDELVAHAGQSGDRVGCQAQALVGYLVGQPL